MEIARFNVAGVGRIVVGVFGTLLSGAPNFARASGFDVSCGLPFDAIKVHHPIDDSCAKRGDVAEPPLGANDAPHASQNEAKNNYCASGVPAVITFATFARLQKKLDQKIAAA